MRLGIGKRHKRGKPLLIFSLFFVLTLFGLHRFLKRAEPVFVAQSSNYSNTAFTDLVNKCIVEAAKTEDFGNFFSYSSENGINTMHADTARLNLVVSQLMINIQNTLNSDYPAKLYIPLGSLSGYYLLSSAGPSVPVKIIPISVVNSSFDESFESAGINQVRYKLSLKVTVDMLYRGYLLNETERIETTVPLAENIISGTVPQYYGGGFINSDNVNVAGRE